MVNRLFIEAIARLAFAHQPKSMKQKVYSKEEAMQFFLSNHSDSVICVKNGKEKEVSAYPDAERFFDQ